MKRDFEELCDDIEMFFINKNKKVFGELIIYTVKDVNNFIYPLKYKKTEAYVRSAMNYLVDIGILSKIIKGRRFYYQIVQNVDDIYGEVVGKEGEYFICYPYKKKIVKVKK